MWLGWPAITSPGREVAFYYLAEGEVLESVKVERNKTVLTSRRGGAPIVTTWTNVSLYGVVKPDGELMRL